MESRALRVGELASRTGVSVRTLHHYHEIGLLVPSFHSAGSQRLYARGEVERLQRILSLRQLGLSLQEIRSNLDDPGASALEVVERHRQELDQRLEIQKRLRDRLERIARLLRARATVALEDLLDAIEDTTRVERYFDAEQLQSLEQRREAVGEERIAAVQEEWKELFRELEAEMRRGAEPGDPAVHVLAERGRGLVAEFTGGNPGITRSVARMYAEEGAPTVLTPHGFGFGPEVYALFTRAMQALGGGEESKGRS